MKIILYSTGCPKCKILESKLNAKNIQYDKNTDSDEMIRLGFQTVPKLKVDDELLDFGEAVKWINNRKDD